METKTHKIEEVQCKKGLRFRVVGTNMIWLTREEAEDFIPRLIQKELDEAERLARLEAERPAMEARAAKNLARKQRKYRRKLAEKAAEEARRTAMTQEERDAEDEAAAELSLAINGYGGYGRLSAKGFDIGSLKLNENGELYGFNHLREGYAKA